MSDSLACDRCGKVGYRRLSRTAPEGWFYAEFKCEDTGKVYIIYACSFTCAHVEWKAGPGNLKDGLKDDPR
jgi:hypothetical protein